VTGPELTFALNALAAGGLISSWHRASGWMGVQWVVVPLAGPAVRYTRAEIVDFIEFAQEVACV
jgi:hypothetical protein